MDVFSRRGQGVGRESRGTNDGDKAAATQVYAASISTIDRIADKKIIHKNKAARHKSRMAAALKALA